MVRCSECGYEYGSLIAAERCAEALKQAGFWSQHDTIARLAKGRANRVDETVVA